LVVPQAIAYAQIDQLPPQAGLFAAFAGLLD
jgi:MFS superfamily sulfate permease-like transporter